MSAQPKPKPVTFAEFLAFEEKSESKHEFFAGEIFAMAGASRDHNVICSNLNRRLGNHLEGKPCHAVANDLLVQVEATGLTIYPDIVVVCDDEKFADDKERVLLNPTVLIEVASPSTEKYDRSVKLRHCQTIPSLKEFLLVSQDEPAVERFQREPDGRWVNTFVRGLDAELRLDSLGLRVPLSQVYDRVSFPPPPPHPGATE
jgi:Uma2 family endonuclease